VANDAEYRWFSILFERDHADMLAAFNVSESPQSIGLSLPSGDWRRELATDETTYGGGRPLAPTSLRSTGEGSVILELGGFSAAVYAREYK
jgi:hypothetical protein